MILKRAYLLITILIALLAISGDCMAQAVPDTSLNNINQKDSIRRADMAAAADTNGTLLNSKVVADVKVDSTPLLAAKPMLFQPDPKKAGLYSAIFPGLGQLYNRQYWKIPVIYAGIAVTAYFFQDNLKNYDTYRRAYIGRVNNPYPTDQFVNIYSQDQLKQLQDDYQRYLDMTVLLAGVGYAIQILDAVAFAHLKNFDMSPDISMRVQPVATPMGVGLGLVFNLK